MTDEKGKWQTWTEECHADIELFRAVKENNITVKEIEDYSRISAETRSQLMQHGLKLELIDGHPIVTKFEE